MANRLPRIEISGADGLIELLKTLPEKQLLPAASKGLRAVGSKTIRDARSRLRRGHGLDTGALKKSLGVRKVKTYKKEGRVVMYIGPRRGFGITKGKRKHDPFFIAHLVEFGHRTAVHALTGRVTKNVVFGKQRRDGTIYRPVGKLALAKNAGDVPAKPFLRPAVDANKGEFNKQMAEKIRDVISKAKAKSK